MMSADDDDFGADEAVISFNDEDEDDDEMAELFSFGATASPKSNKNYNNNNNNNSNKSSQKIDYSAAMASVMPLPRSSSQDTDDDESSEDSFMELLEQNKEITVLDPAAVKARNQKTSGSGSGNGNDPENTNDNNNNNNNSSNEEFDESNMQEILDWLDAEDEKDQEEELYFMEPPKPPTLEESILKKQQQQQQQVPTSPPPPPEFDTLEQAVKSPKSQISQIRRLLEKENFVIPSSVRPYLWCRVVCGKTLDEILQSSVADSFQQWEKHWNQQQQLDANNNNSSKLSSLKIRKKQLDWIQKESAYLADRIAIVLKSDKELCQRALSSILINHYCTVNKNIDLNDDDEGKQQTEDDNDDDNDNEAMDTLLPPVACVLLSAGIPKVGAAVMLSHIVPHYMPILALTTKERTQAASLLHRQFYLLACYHLPLLAIHLDRFFPEWYKWPPKGFLPQSYLISHLAGECGKEADIHPRSLLCLWDLILSSSNNSLRFFLIMAILEQHSDQLLLLTADDLKDEMQRVLSFKQHMTEDGFQIEAEDEKTSKQAIQWVHDWTEKAQTIWENTPRSVVRMLKHLEDEAVSDALTKRQREVEERLKLKLEAQARAHQEAIEAEQERKAEAARLRLTRARLVAFYRQYNPGKENNIDKIMTTYEGRYDVLDAKLKQKYGVGFNPAVKPKPPPSQNKSNQKNVPGFGVRRQHHDESKRKDQEDDSKKPRDMAVQIQPRELIPSICWSKEANKANLLKLKKQSSKLAQSDATKLPLKFYLVDSRPEDSVLDQGRFPTSISLSPDVLLDFDRMKQMEEMFEGLRGTVHICIMGEGYAALPDLYGHKVTRGLLEFIKQDEARIMNCALFFLKRGFPFVSILTGGFAGAHAFLWREGATFHLRAQNVLTDYNPEVSIFGQFERAHNASGREKAQRTLQGFFDTGLTALAKNTMRFESLASEVGTGVEEEQAKSGKNVVSLFWGNNESSKQEDTGKGSSTEKPENSGTTPATGFLNPFARKAQEINEKQNISKQQSSASLEVESVDFDKPTEGNPDQSSSSETNNEATKQQQSQETTTTSAESSAKANPFSGLGAALNQSLKAGASAPSSNPATESQAAGRPRNPFARFGMGGANNQNNNTTKKVEVKSPGMVNHFVGLNQLRKNTMARMISGGGGGSGADGTANNSADSNDGGKESESIDDGVVAEDTVSLNESSPAIASNSNNSGGAVVEVEKELKTPDNNNDNTSKDVPIVSNQGDGTKETSEEEQQQTQEIQNEKTETETDTTTTTVAPSPTPPVEAAAPRKANIAKV